MKTILVLGAGLGAMAPIRQTMRNVVLKSDDFKMVVVAPNTHFHFPIAMPRVIVPDQMSEEKVLLPLDRQFEHYSTDKFEFLLGKAETLDPRRKTVEVALNDGGGRSVSYDMLIVATGASPSDHVPWKTVHSTEDTKKKIHQVREDIKRAKTIVVAGGGLTGAETAAELGFEYGKSEEKDIYLVHVGDLPLTADALESVRTQAKTELERLNVKLVPNTTVTRTTSSGKDTILELTKKDGTTETMTAEAYIPATGLYPNTSFAPQEMLDSKGYLKQTKTLQAEGQPDIFVIGDAGNLEASKAMIADAQAVHLVKALPDLLLKGTTIPEYRLDTRNAFAATLGQSKGTGQMYGWKLPSIMVWFVKGRTLFTDALDAVVMGKRTTSTVFEN